MEIFGVFNDFLPPRYLSNLMTAPLACEKDLTDLIDLEDVTMNIGDLRGDHGSKSNSFGS